MTTINAPVPVVPDPKKGSKTNSRIRTARLSDEDADRLDQALDSNLSYNTKYYYKYVWRTFTDWSHNQGVNPLPSTPALVAKYLVHLDQERGLTKPSIQIHKTAIAATHRGADHDDPTNSMDVQLAMCEIAQAQGMKAKQPANLLTNDDMVAIRATAEIKRPYGGRGKGVESNKRAARRARIDIDLLSLLRDIRIPRSDAAALTWADIELRKNGTGCVTITKRRKNRNDKVQLLNISRETARDLSTIRPEDPDSEGLVFGITAFQMRARIRAATQAAGLGYDYLITPQT